ncbi:MAG: 16S rRNA (adenine1518-N6/adenine1519-N6)-dimethyltransferase, partial [Lentisphaeria bacterium]
GIVKDMHFMLQKEVVARLAAGPGDKNYGRLSIMAQYYCEVEHLFDVPPESFDPAPKVESAIVRLTPYTLLPAIAENLGNFEHMVKTAFQQRRKTLRNGLKALVSDEQAQQVGLDLTLRAENLSMQEYVRLSNTLWGSNDIGDAIL